MRGRWARWPWRAYVLTAVALALLGVLLWQLGGLTLPVSHIAALFGGGAEQHQGPPPTAGASPAAQPGQHAEPWRPVQGLTQLLNVVWWTALVVLPWTGLERIWKCRRKTPGRV